MIQAGRLEKGNVVYSLDGKKETVESAETEEADEEEETVYNFEVEEYHTYFVGEDKILVHNNCAKEATKLLEAGKEAPITDPSRLLEAPKGSVDVVDINLKYKKG